MNTPHRPLLSRRAALAFGITAATLFAPAAFAQVTTGFNQTGAGSWDYNTTTNWVGPINGVWSSDLTLVAAQAVTFGADTVLNTGFNIGYTGGFDLTFRSDGTAARTITLGGDLTIAPVTGNRNVTFGSAVANDGLNVNLGGNRTFTVATSKTLRFYNTISGGNITLDGTTGSAAGGTMRLMGTGGNASTSAITVTRNASLVFDSSVSGNTGATRAQSLTLNGGTLSITANAGANTVEAVTGNIVSSGAYGNYNIVSIAPSGTRHAQLTANALTRTDNGVTLFRGGNLGANSITSATNGSSNISFATDLTTSLVGGGGAAGSTTISILQGAIGGTTASDNGSTFVTYTAANGIRPLDVSEFAASITDGTNTANNVRLNGAGSLATINSATTINSLIFNPVTSAATIDGTGVLTITSGQVLLNTTNVAFGTTINVGLNFGSVEGVIGSTFNRTATINGPVSGTGGLTIYNLAGNTSAITGGLSVTGTGHSYTGDINVLGRLAVNSASDFLPSAARTGNINIRDNGSVIISAGNYTINGLNGTGRFTYGSSGGGILTLGDSNASGDFSGVITLSNGGTGGLTKIGTGTQILSGLNNYKGVTSIQGGVLSVNTMTDGNVISAIGLGTNAAGNIVMNNGTLRYTGAAASTDRLFTTGALGGTLESSGTGALHFTNTGNNASAEAANRNGTRESGSAVVTGVTNFTDLVVGARVTGTGITAGTTITAIDTIAGTITLSSAVTTNVTNGSMSFATDRTLRLSGTNNGDNIIGSNLINGSNGGLLSVNKEGTGTWTLSGNNTYTGTTTISQGTLALGASNRIADASNLILSGGTFATRGFSETLGSLSLTANSFIDLGVGASALVFADSSSATWNNSVTLSFLNFTEGVDSVRIGTNGSGLTEGQLAQIIINGTNYAAIDGSGYLILGAAIPEPSSIALLGGLGALAFAGLRRRSRVTFGA